MNYSNLQQLLNNTCCHHVFLVKDNQNYFGIYNGLSNWGEVYSLNNGQDCYVVDALSTDIEDCFTLNDFRNAGYAILED